METADDTSNNGSDETQKSTTIEHQEHNITFEDPTGEAEENFYHILLFLWAMIHRNEKLQALTAIPVTDNEATDWSDNIHFINLKQSHPTGS